MGPVGRAQSEVDSGSGPTDRVKRPAAVLDRFPDQLKDQALGRVQSLGFGLRQSKAFEREPCEDVI